jgi:hypothetical protein
MKKPKIFSWNKRIYPEIFIPAFIFGFLLMEYLIHR